MNRNKSILYALFFFLCCVIPLSAEEVFASIIYAEGESFRLIRDGRPRKISVESKEVFGMEVKPGDIFQTASETLLEFTIHELGATVKIAENTSFRFDREPENNRTTGELYYGRVRAKVDRLARGSTYRISSPSLVAGVRGTDFGLDVIALRQVSTEAEPGPEDTGREYSAADAESAVMHRVFCFEGSVLVGDFSGPDLDTIILTAGEKVERVVIPAEETEPEPLKKQRINNEIREFWDMRPFRGIETGIIPVADISDTEQTSDTGKPKARPLKFGSNRSAKHMRIPGALTSTLMVLGTTAFVSSAVLDSVTSDDWIVRSAQTSGCIMIGSGLVITVLSLVAR